jgi:alpha/beta superfamily hydrolase
VIIIHDKGTDRVHGVHGQLMSIAARLVERGFPVLAFDLRGSGQSQGALFTLGAHQVHAALHAAEGAVGRHRS